jgi:uncharacterized protein (DUF433 family)
MQKEYIKNIEGVFRVGDTRVSLDLLVYLFLEGMSAETMVECYPALTLEQVHGALAFYLGNQKEIDQYVAEGQRAAEAQHQQSRKTNAELIAKLQRARHPSEIPGLTAISTGASFEACAGPLQKSTSGRQPRRGLKG